MKQSLLIVGVMSGALLHAQGDDNVRVEIRNTYSDWVVIWLSANQFFNDTAQAGVKNNIGNVAAIPPLTVSYEYRNKKGSKKFQFTDSSDIAFTIASHVRNVVMQVQVEQLGAMDIKDDSMEIG